ncbi:MAG: hypothetical protein ACI9KD_003272 [Congregibacter sp.]|jgi:hypothetical protein
MLIFLPFTEFFVFHRYFPLGNGWVQRALIYVGAYTDTREG